jgi:hypothetical protein
MSPLIAESRNQKVRTKREGEESVLRCALGHIPLPIQYPKPPQNSSCTPERDPTVVGTEFLCLGQTPQETNTRPKGQSDITGEQPVAPPCQT